MSGEIKIALADMDEIKENKTSWGRAIKLTFYKIMLNNWPYVNQSSYIVRCTVISYEFHSLVSSKKLHDRCISSRQSYDNLHTKYIKIRSAVCYPNTRQSDPKQEY